MDIEILTNGPLNPEEFASLFDLPIPKNPVLVGFKNSRSPSGSEETEWIRRVFISGEWREGNYQVRSGVQKSLGILDKSINLQNNFPEFNIFFWRSFLEWLANMAIEWRSELKNEFGVAYYIHLLQSLTQQLRTYSPSYRSWRDVDDYSFRLFPLYFDLIVKKLKSEPPKDLVDIAALYRFHEDSPSLIFYSIYPELKDSFPGIRTKEEIGNLTLREVLTLYISMKEGLSDFSIKTLLSIYSPEYIMNYWKNLSGEKDGF